MLGGLARTRTRTRHQAVDGASVDEREALTSLSTFLVRVFSPL